VAVQMDIEAMERLQTDLSLSVSRISGPDGGTAEKPVRMV